METWLQEHAIEHVWCNPALDRRRFIKPCRLSPPEGDVCQIRVSEHQIGLPDPTLWYTVFQIGLLRPDTVGIDEYWSGWVTAETLLNRFGTIIQVYNEGGRTIPLSLVWMRVLSNGNFIIAIERVDKQLTFAREDLYIRFYAGYFKQSPEWTPSHRTFSESAYLRNGEAMTDFILRYRDTKRLPGFTFAFVNGYPVRDLTFENVALWDRVEYVHDGSVVEVYDFAVKDLVNFTSTLDKCRKAILHPPKKREEINYLNDVDIYLFASDNGRYYTLHKTADLRQLTHRDFAIPAANITKYAQGNPIEWADEDNLTLRLFIRRSGMTRPLTYETNRIHELYKLNDAGIVQAFSGVNAVMPEWRAEHLEMSAYVRLMSSMGTKINRELASRAYGYNAVSKYAADTPTKVIEEGGVKYAVLPPLLKANSTVYEYDSAGLLLGFYLNDHDEVIGRWTCRNDNAALVEVIEGRGSNTLDINFNAVGYKLEPGYNHRFYLQTLRSGVPTDEWEDVTGDLNSYQVDEDGIVHWKVDLKRRQPAIWRDSRFLAYDFIEDAYDGTLRFSLNSFRADQEGPWVMHFHAMTLELWMNGHPLINGLDYVVKWPQIIICNKQYLDYSGEYHRPKITVRARNQSKEFVAPEYGHVINGLLSNNNRFDVRDDKVVRIVADGAVRHREDVEFREDIGVNLHNVRNGAPYIIEDPLVPLRRTVEFDTYVMHGEAKVVDQHVQGYLTSKIPQLPMVQHNPIDGKHVVFSPMLNKIIHDLINGIFLPTEDPDINFIPTDELDKMLEPYKYLADYDPLKNGVDLRYVDVQPHDGLTPVTLTELHYSIVERANDLWFDSAIDLNKLIKLQVKDG